MPNLSGLQRMVRDLAPAAVGKITSATIKVAADKLATQLVTRAAAREMAAIGATAAANTAAGGIGSLAVRDVCAQAAVNLAARRAAAKTITTVAGKAAGVLAAPVTEVVAMKLDGKDHDPRDYAIVAGCGAASAVTGMLAGAAVGSAVPFVGTAVGAVVGFTACTALKAQLLHD